MLMELTVVPFTRGPSISGDIAELVDLIDHSGLPYRLTPFGTLIEGEWGPLMDIVKQCHTAIRKKTDRVLITIRLDDYANRTDLLATAVAHVENHLGRSVSR